MNNHLSITKHISAQFNSELEQAMNQVMSMGGFVEQQLNDAVKALNEHDTIFAKKIIEQDAIVNKMEVDINEMCIKIIAKRQPTASDLRLLIVIIKTVSELERVGDVARRVSRLTLNPSANEERFKSMLVSFDSLAKRSIEFLRNVLDSFARMDLAQTVLLYKENEKIDQEYEAIMRQLITYIMEDPRSIKDILVFQNGARSLGKIGDRCLNICEYIVYFIQGENIRLRGKEAIDELIKEMNLLDRE